VALLLFGIGLELPLSKLKRLWKLAIIGGFLQVGLSILAAYSVARLSGLSVNSAIIIGFIVALSSTAVVLRGLQQRGEVDAPHGRLILGILVFQDLSVVPIMLAIPLLIGVALNPGDLTLILAKSVGIVLFVLFSAIVIVPRLLRFVAQTGQRQLFILSVFVICMGTAWLVTYSGASLAIGAFLAGLVVAGSEYRHQAMSDMISFREIFSSLFFVSVGMLLQLDVIYNNLLPIMQILIAIILGKSAIVFIVSLVMRMPLRISIISALALAQIGEFSLVLFYSIQDKGLLSKTLESNMISAAILSMFITPFFLAFGPKLAAGLGKLRWLRTPISVKSVEESSATICTMCDHIIIAGYGFAGRVLSQSLKENNIPFIIVDINIENVRKASTEVGNAVFGDITSHSVLSQLGIQNARELVLLINDLTASKQAVQTAQRLAANLHITVRTSYLLDIEQLQILGADEIIASEREAAVQVIAQVLSRNMLDSDVISRMVDKYRAQDEDN
jgi:CPA2 family monovalent cation:H+ antiporter-2